MEQGSTSIVFFFFFFFFFELALGDGASNMSRDTHCATCHELVFLKLYLAFFSNTSCFYLCITDLRGGI